MEDWAFHLKMLVWCLQVQVPSKLAHFLDLQSIMPQNMMDIISGFGLLIFQVFLYPPIERLLGSINSIRVAAVTITCSHIPSFIRAKNHLSSILDAHYFPKCRFCLCLCLPLIHLCQVYQGFHSRSSWISHLCWRMFFLWSSLLAYSFCKTTRCLKNKEELQMGYLWLQCPFSKQLLLQLGVSYFPGHRNANMPFYFLVIRLFSSFWTWWNWQASSYASSLS